MAEPHDSREPTSLVPSARAPERARWLSHAYRALVRCSRALVRARSEEQLLGDLCRILVTEGGYELAWVGLAEDDPARTVRCVAQAGRAEGYLDALHTSWGDDARERGPMGTAIRTGAPVVLPDIAADGGAGRWRDLALARGFASAIALPLLHGERAFGAIAAYSRRAQAFDDDEVSLLVQLGEDLAYGLSALRDRAQREGAELRLFEREVAYRQIIQNFPLGALGLYDRDLRYVLIDGEGLRSIGHSAASLEGRTVAEVFPTGLAALLEPLYRRALAGAADRQEVAFAGRVFDVSVRPVRAADGSVSLGFVCSVDVTESKAAEAARAASEELFRNAFEHSQIGKVLTGLDGRFLRLNPAMCRMLGYTADELVGRHFNDVTHPDDWTLGHDGVRRILSGESNTFRCEKRYLHKHGRVVWGEAVISLVRAADGTPRHFIVGVQDLTARRHTEEQLRQAQKLEAVGQLAAGIAHEINTPAQFIGDNLRFLSDAFTALSTLRRIYRETLAELSSAPGYDRVCALLDEAEAEADVGFLEGDAPGAFQSALEGIARVSTIVRSMKEFAYPDQAEQVPADLNRALSTTLTIARNEYKYVADVETDLGELPPVVCHVGALNQAFLNLLVNAAHAIADKVGKSGARGKITIRTRPVEGDVRIDIEDTGSGIPEAARSRVFDPFFTTKEIGRGSGQGLAIARSVIVDRHGGAIRFESELGRGTTFTILLPVAGRPARG